MTPLRILLCALCAITLSANSASSTLHKDTYTVLPAFQLDLKRMVVHSFVDGRPRIDKIEDCSNTEAFCFQSTCGPYAYPRVTPDNCKLGDHFAIVWPRQCVRHFEIGETIEAGGMSAEVIGYYDAILHHTGLRGRRLIVAIEGKPDMAVLVSRTTIVGILIDTKGQRQIKKALENTPIIDESELDLIRSSGIVKTNVLPHGIKGKCSE